jgi:2-succinyl-6-hydroxy-2,4-cyclohexadiene-1-carboxylate synthase
MSSRPVRNVAAPAGQGISPAVHARLEVEGRTIGYFDTAPARNDLPVLLALHGFTGDCTTWSDLATALAASWRIIALDLPGHGATPWTRRDAPCTLDRCAELMASVLERLGVRRAALLGYSMGGRLALAAALRDRELFPWLVLESASAGIRGADERGRRRRDDEALAARIVAGGIERFVNGWERQPLFASQQRLLADRRATLRRQRLGCSAEGLAASLHAMGAGAQEWLGDRLPELQRPVLLIAGALDAKYRAIAADMGAAIDGARVEIVPDAGHAVHLEAPERFHDLVSDFLRASVDQVGAGGAKRIKPGGMPCR